MNLAKTQRYCIRCSKPAKYQEPAHLQCDACGLSNYLNSKPCTIIVLVNDNNEVLLMKRNHEPSRGKWDLPGGFVENGESFEEGALREIKEETGLMIKSLSYVTSVTDTYDYQDVTYSTLAVVFTARCNLSYEITLSDENSEYKWFTRNNLPIDQLAFPSLGVALRSIRSD